MDVEDAVESAGGIAVEGERALVDRFQGQKVAPWKTGVMPYEIIFAKLPSSFKPSKSWNPSAIVRLDNHYPYKPLTASTVQDQLRDVSLVYRITLMPALKNLVANNADREHILAWLSQHVVHYLEKVYDDELDMLPVDQLELSLQREQHLQVIHSTMLQAQVNSFVSALVKPGLGHSLSFSVRAEETRFRRGGSNEVMRFKLGPVGYLYFVTNVTGKIDVCDSIGRLRPAAPLNLALPLAVDVAYFSDPRLLSDDNRIENGPMRAVRSLRFPREAPLQRHYPWLKTLLQARLANVVTHLPSKMLGHLSADATEAILETARRWKGHLSALPASDPQVFKERENAVLRQLSLGINAQAGMVCDVLQYVLHASSALPLPNSSEMRLDPSLSTMRPSGRNWQPLVDQVKHMFLIDNSHRLQWRTKAAAARHSRATARREGASKYGPEKIEETLHELLEHYGRLRSTEHPQRAENGFEAVGVGACDVVLAHDPAPLLLLLSQRLQRKAKLVKTLAASARLQAAHWDIHRDLVDTRPTYDERRASKRTTGEDNVGGTKKKRRRSEKGDDATRFVYKPPRHSLRLRSFGSARVDGCDRLVLRPTPHAGDGTAAMDLGMAMLFDAHPLPSRRKVSAEEFVATRQPLPSKKRHFEQLARELPAAVPTIDVPLAKPAEHARRRNVLLAEESTDIEDDGELDRLLGARCDNLDSSFVAPDMTELTQTESQSQGQRDPFAFLNDGTQVDDSPRAPPTKAPRLARTQTDSQETRWSGAFFHHDLGGAATQVDDSPVARSAIASPVLSPLPNDNYAVSAEEAPADLGADHFLLDFTKDPTPGHLASLGMPSSALMARIQSLVAAQRAGDGSPLFTRKFAPSALVAMAVLCEEAAREEALQFQRSGRLVGFSEQALYEETMAQIDGCADPAAIDFDELRTLLEALFRRDLSAHVGIIADAVDHYIATRPPTAPTLDLMGSYNVETVSTIPRGGGLVAAPRNEVNKHAWDRVAGVRTEFRDLPPQGQGLRTFFVQEVQFRTAAGQARHSKAKVGLHRADGGRARGRLQDEAHM